MFISTKTLHSLVLPIMVLWSSLCSADVTEWEELQDKEGHLEFTEGCFVQGEPLQSGLSCLATAKLSGVGVAAVEARSQWSLRLEGRRRFRGTVTRSEQQDGTVGVELCDQGRVTQLTALAQGCWAERKGLTTVHQRAKTLVSHSTSLF